MANLDHDARNFFQAVLVVIAVYLICGLILWGVVSLKPAAASESVTEFGKTSPAPPPYDAPCSGPGYVVEFGSTSVLAEAFVIERADPYSRAVVMIYPADCLLKDGFETR